MNLMKQIKKLKKPFCQNSDKLAKKTRNCKIDSLKSPVNLDPKKQRFLTRAADESDVRERIDLGQCGVAAEVAALADERAREIVSRRVVASTFRQL
ncbi:hypothetical protein CASFOL_034507 [Castilleja foliolosa]|uniref:Uncharacterized protein n=1 Tax=Castilleja foliolosa TaxID=1961234 RepID=A0ABD3BQ63_9LAMI